MDLISPIAQSRAFNLKTLLGVSTIHLLALAAIFTYTWQGLLALIIMVWVTGCLGITLGYHRMLAHRSFEAPKPLRYLLAFFGCLALQNGPLRWVATHRLHHKHADTPQDPHSSEEGFLWSHLCWNFFRQPELKNTDTMKRYALDIYKDPVLLWMDKYFLALYLGFSLTLFAVVTAIAGWQIGLSVLVWGCIFRVVFVWHSTWLVNSATHYWGYQSFDSADKSRNNWWVAWLTFGEGWHNNHHAHPRSARMGLKWYEPDVTYAIIKTLEKLGLASKVTQYKATANS